MKDSHHWDLKWMAWEITSRCNLRCVHCRSASGEDADAGIFTLSLAKELLDQVKDFASPVIVLTGGEPLLRDDLPDILNYGTRKGFRMCVATNGTLIDDAWCLEFIKSGVKIVSLSLDGASASVHDDFRRQEGAFAGTLRGIESLKRNGIPFLINSSFTKRNFSDVQATYAFVKKLGAKAWYMFAVVPVGRGQDIKDELLSPDQYREFLKWHLEMERTEDEMLVRPTCAPQYYRLLAEDEAASMAGGGSEPVKRRSLKFSTGGAKGCIAGQSILLIDSKGDVRPCSYFPLSAGNIEKEPLKDIWNNSKLFKELRDFSSYKGVCGRCPHLNVCGGCRVRAYYGNNDYLGQDPLCIPAFGSPLK